MDRLYLIAVAATVVCGCRYRFENLGQDADITVVDADPTLPDANTTMGALLPVPAGSFMMGCNTVIDTRCDLDESPYHSVTLSAFMIERTEVSQSAYEDCVVAGQCSTPACEFAPQTTPDLPVVCVVWSQADEYCQWRGRRLPTEAEWEKAARGVDGRLYPWGNSAPNCTLLNWFGCPPDADVVDAYGPGVSPYGAVSMAGNVWEWVNDYYVDDYYSSSPTTDPPGPASGTRRVRRGGSYISGLDLIRVSNRFATLPDLVENNIGFRCAQ